MPVELRNGVATVSGVLTVEEVEPLTAWLRITPRPRVNLRACTHLHTAGLQALIAFEAKVSSAPTDPFLATHVVPMLTLSA